LGGDGRLRHRHRRHHRLCRAQADRRRLRQGRLSVKARVASFAVVASLLSLYLPSPALAAPTRLALSPPHDGALGSAAARVEAALVEAAQALPGYAVVNLSGGRLAGPRQVDARLEAQPAARALALGKEMGAARAVAVEATPLGEGLIVYLQALDVPS